MSEEAATTMIGHNQPPVDEVIRDTRADLLDRAKKMKARLEAAPKVTSQKKLEEVALIVRDAKALAKELEEARVADKDPFLRGGKAVDAFYKDEQKPIKDAIDTVVQSADAYQREQRRKENERLAAEQAQRDAEARKKEQEAAEAAAKAAENSLSSEDAAAAARLAAQAENAAAMAASAAAATAKAAEPIKTKTASGVSVSTKSKDAVRISDYDDLDLNKLKPYMNREHVQLALNGWLKFTKGADKLAGAEIYQESVTNFR